MVRRGVINSITRAFTKYYNNIIPCTQYYCHCHIIIIILIFEYFRVRFPRTGNTSDILGLTGFLMYKLRGCILYKYIIRRVHCTNLVIIIWTLFISIFCNNIIMAMTQRRRIGLVIPRHFCCDDFMTCVSVKKKKLSRIKPATVFFLFRRNFETCAAPSG